MKRLCVILLAAALLSALTACGNTAAPAETDKGNAAAQPVSSADAAAPTRETKPTSPEEAPAQAEETEKEAAYPFEDADGRVHHLIYINDALVETEHDAYGA